MCSPSKRTSLGARSSWSKNWIFLVKHLCSIPNESAVRFHRRANAAFVDGEQGLVHGTAPSHRLPDLAEVVDVMSEDDTLIEHRRSKHPLVDELKGDVFANHVAVVDEKEHFLRQ